MGLIFEDVKLDHIGRGGVDDDVPLVELAEAELREVCQLVAHPLHDDKGSVTIKVDVRKLEDGGLLIAGKVSSRLPSRDIKALSAQVDPDGNVQCVQHKQEPLPLGGNGVTTLKTAKEG